MKKICILLAAYNGALWIGEQLESILSQSGVEVSVFISVDFSDDNTFEICNDYKRRFNNVHVLEYGDSYGSAALNFFRLVRDVDASSFDYIAFSDQDDVWLPEKMHRAINVLSNEGADCYASDLTLWENGKIGKKLTKSQKQRMYDYIFQGASAGCTYVFNSQSFFYFKTKVSNNSLIEKNMSHDWIAYAVTRSRKYKWIIDPVSFFLYRQHSMNVQGARLGLLGGMKKIMQIRSGWYFSNIFKMMNFLEMDDGEKRIFQKLSNKNLTSRLWLVFNIFKYRRKFFDALILGLFFICY